MSHFYNKLRIRENNSLINILALIGFLGSLFIFTILLIYYGWPEKSNRWLFVVTMLAYLMILVLNKLGYSLIAKYLLSYVAILGCFAISVVNKVIGPIFINDYYVFRIVLLTISIIPILVFRYDQYLHLAANLLPSFLSLLFFDTIHELFDIGIFSTGYEDETYFMTTNVTIMCYFALNGFIYALKRKNDLYFAKLEASNQQLEDQFEELQQMNEEIENQNKTIVDQNSQLKNFSLKLKEKVESRTRELTKLNKELAEQNVRLEQFTFITAHNIKSPIAQIKGLLNLLNYENGLNKSTKSILFKIGGSCDNLNDVISDLNKILNIKNDSHILERTNVAEIIDHILFDLKNDIKKNKIKIRRKYTPIAEIYGIKAFIYSILFNLIQNAVKFHDPDKEDRFVEISIHENERDLGLEISDNGIGFEQELVKEKLFQLYQRFNTSIIGKGLGLYLVKVQLDMIDGKVEVQSEKGTGTTIRLILPKKVEALNR